MGLTGYYKRFIKGFLKLALPLTHLTRKGQAFMCYVQCEGSFRELKKKYPMAPFLIVPNVEEPFYGIL